MSKNNSSKKKNNNREKFDIEKAVMEDNTNNSKVSVLIDEDLRSNKEKNVKKKVRHIFVHTFLIILLLCSLVFFGLKIYNKETTATDLINNLILTVFTIIFVAVSINYQKKNKSIIFVCGLLLFSYLILNFHGLDKIINIPSRSVENFSGKSLTYVMKWAEANNITVKQEFEFSDMVSEYKVISQNISSGTKIKDLDEITISVSEGPNPSKEIIIPSMISWDTKRVVNFVKDNYLSNVEVEFVESDKAKDTVIEQNTSGSLKRDDELKLKFSYGEELGFDEVTLIDFTGMSKFEIEFFMKQHQLKYSFDEDFSNKEKRGYGMKQNIEAGKKVKVNDQEVKVTISKGPEIKVPNLEGMTITEVTEWAIKNKVKLEFSDKYDDSISENAVISTNYSKGKIIEQGTVIKIVLSRGKLKMPKFKSFNEFREWADKYEIKYEEKHEFNDSVAAGEVISYSYKTGDTIKNDDTIIVKISDGKKCEVPNLKGLTKKEAISKLEKVNLKYNFVYKASKDIAKDKVISQSISAGSEVSSGTTITVTLSNGKKESSSNSSTSNKPNNSGNSNGNNNSGGDNRPVTPSCDKNKTTKVYIYDELLSSTPSTTCSKLKSAYPGIKFSCSYVKNPGLSNGMIENANSLDAKDLNYCDSYSVLIVSN